MGAPEVEAFLTDLATRGKVPAPTRLDGIHWLFAGLMYGSGLRLMDLY